MGILLNDWQKFLRYYRQLCEKYQLFITACGCCNSPFMVKADDKNIDTNINESIEHLKNEWIKLMK